MRAENRDAAYTEFVRARRTHLRRIAYAICGDWHRADDLVQTALVKLYVAWPRVRRDGHEDAYVRTIIVRANIDDSRRPWRRGAGRARRTRAGARASRSRSRSARRCSTPCSELPLMQRKTVLLRHWLGLSVAETASRARRSARGR